MLTLVRQTAISCICLFSYTFCFSQDSSSLADKIFNFPTKLFRKVNDQTADLNKDLEKETAKYIMRLQKKEQRLKKKFYKLDSASAKDLFANDPGLQYQVLLQKLKTDTSAGSKYFNGQYLPYEDSLKTSLVFLNKNPNLINTSAYVPADLKNSLANLQEFEAKLQNAQNIQQFIAQRKEQIKEYLAKYTQLPGGIKNIYTEYNKQLYYYDEQVNQYKEILNDPDKLTKLALSILNKISPFTNFMKSNSMLASLFSMPGNIGSVLSVEGLQSRNQIASTIQGLVTGGGSNASSVLQQNVGSAQGELDQLKSKLSSYGSNGGDIDVPNFKPNNQKTKSFLQRLEFGSDIQTNHSTYYFPTTTSLGLTIAYKLDNANDFGVGASYKMGWGTNFQNVHFSSQGLGLRSFVDIQIKKSFFGSGGFEYNYQQPFASFQQISHSSGWQQSGMVGITKVISMQTRVLKKTKLQFLWDFLSYQQFPRTQPFIFRVGYSF